MPAGETLLFERVGYIREPSLAGRHLSALRADPARRRDPQLVDAVGLDDGRGVALCVVGLIDRELRQSQLKRIILGNAFRVRHDL